ncbi:MAG: hypothetical protein ACW964_08985, partial [Candidatus Hodarchaeales archaeon]
MCNETMNFFLDIFDSGKSTDGNFKLLHYSFSWFNTVIESKISPINTTDLSQYWSNVSRSDSTSLISYWINGTQFNINQPHLEMSFIQKYIAINISSFDVKWIFYGDFYYGDGYGDVGGRFITVE